MSDRRKSLDYVEKAIDLLECVYDLVCVAQYGGPEGIRKLAEAENGIDRIITKLHEVHDLIILAEMEDGE